MEKWTARVVGKMHLHKITQSELAKAVGVTRIYLNRVLNGVENPANARERITQALDELIASKS